MERNSFFEAKFDKFNNNCFFFDENIETKKLIGKNIKFLNFELIDRNVYDKEIMDITSDKLILSITLSSSKNDIENSSKALAEITLNKGDKDSQSRHIYNNFTNINKESYLKLEEINFDKQENLSTLVQKYFLKIYYENFTHFTNNSNSNMNNMPKVIVTNIAYNSKNYFDMLKENVLEEDGEDEEDEDYEESQNDSSDNSLTSDASDEINDNFSKNESHPTLPKENSDHANFVQNLFEEAEDINRDLLYLTDEESLSDNYLHLICEGEKDDECNANKSNNNYNNINPIPGKKRYMLRRKRKHFSN